MAFKLKQLFHIFLFSLITLPSFAISNNQIVIQNLYFPKLGKEKEAYNLRLRASNVLEELGVPKGRVLIRVNEKDRPYIMWECDYSNSEERKNTVKIVKNSLKFREIEKKMSVLVSKFKRYTWQIAK